VLWSRCILWRRRATRLRRLLSIADCADLRIVPTLTRHALRSGRFLLATSAQSCPGARLHSCASARLRAGFACCYPDPRRRDWSESAGTDEVSPGQPCVASHVNLRCLSSVPHAAAGASRIVPTSAACKPVLPGRPRTRSAQSPGRHNRPAVHDSEWRSDAQICAAGSSPAAEASMVAITGYLPCHGAPMSSPEFRAFDLVEAP
jgi:hypothetical protein